MQDYRSLFAVVTICATLVKIQTDRHTQRQHFDLVYTMLPYQRHVEQSATSMFLCRWPCLVHLPSCDHLNDSMFDHLRPVNVGLLTYVTP